MKALEFEGLVGANGQIEVPPQIAQQIPRGEQLQIFVRWGASEDDGWKNRDPLVPRYGQRLWCFGTKTSLGRHWHPGLRDSDFNVYPRVAGGWPNVNFSQLGRLTRPDSEAIDHVLCHVFCARQDE